MARQDMPNRGQKRPCDGLTAPDDLPPAEAAAVENALERWGRLRARAEALRPTLQREDELMQTILDSGLRGEDRKTLRRLASGNGDEEEIVTQVASSIGAEKDKLQAILTRNHRELLELTASTPEAKEDVLREMDEVRGDLKKAQNVVHSELLRAKERSDMAALRSCGRSFNDLKALMRALESERREITKNSALAALLVTVCRRVLPVRQIDPAELRNIEPSHEGHMRIMDFYFFSDASLYCFGEHYSGPNWFTRLKRNVAILLIKDVEENIVYNDFAVSGEHKTPGAPVAPEGGPLQSIEAEDEHGRLFDRRNDAEFKLLSGFCGLFRSSEEGKAWRGSGSLWSKKPLCLSCSGAVKQLLRRFPLLALEIVEGESNDDYYAERRRPQDAESPGRSPARSASASPAARAGGARLPRPPRPAREPENGAEPANGSAPSGS